MSFGRRPCVNRGWFQGLVSTSWLMFPLHSLRYRKPNNECLITAINRHQRTLLCWPGCFQPFACISPPTPPMIFIVLCPFVWERRRRGWSLVAVSTPSVDSLPNEIVNLPLAEHAYGPRLLVSVMGQMIILGRLCTMPNFFIKIKSFI